MSPWSRAPGQFAGLIPSGLRAAQRLQRDGNLGPMAALPRATARASYILAPPIRTPRRPMYACCLAAASRHPDQFSMSSSRVILGLVGWLLVAPVWAASPAPDG